jgi:membrane-bound ClpP family serine protease
MTNRRLVVYFTSQGMIDFSDADDLSEVLNDCDTASVDLLLQSPGGYVDACEKLISILQLRAGSYRVIIPSWAKSAGTIIALASSSIVMGVNSELGPIDPQFNGIPAEFIRDDPHEKFPIRQLARSAIERTQKLAKQVLSEGMLKGARPEIIEDLVKQISSAQSYSSHAAVINVHEAINLGLKVTYLQPDDMLWKRLWLLYCMYDFDCQQREYAKIFEGSRISIARALPPVNRGQGDR